MVLAVAVHPDVTSIPGVTDLRAALTVGAAGCSRPSGRGRVPHARRVRVRDLETGPIWNATGRAVAGPLRGRRVAPLAYLDTDWYAWAPIHSDTTHQLPPLRTVRSATAITSPPGSSILRR